MKKNNILHVVTGLDDGGLEKVVYMIIAANQKEELKHHIVVLIKNTTGFLNDDFLKLGCTISVFDFDNRIMRLNSVPKNLIQLFKLAKMIAAKKINIIHSHDFFPALCARLSAVFAFTFLFHKVDKIFITLHNSFFWLKKPHHLINKILSLVTTKIICVSQSVFEYSLTHDKINKSKYKVIFNGVDTSNYIPDENCIQKYRNEFNIPENNIIIGNVGVLSIRKGQKYIVEAFHHLVKIFPDISLLIFGSQRELEADTANELYELIDKYNLKDKVKIISPRKDLNKIYNIFDIYCMSSITEGLSLSVIEAMLMGRLCLLSDIPSFSEMIKEGVNGYLFKSTDVKDLIEKMSFLISNRDKLNNVKRNAREIALENYSLKRMGNEYSSLYLGN